MNSNTQNMDCNSGQSLMYLVGGSFLQACYSVLQTVCKKMFKATEGKASPSYLSGVALYSVKA